MASERWFGLVEVGALSRTQSAVLDELVEMLEDYRPQDLDRAASDVRASGHGWAVASAVAVRLVHRHDPDATVELAIGDDEVVVAWLAAHEHFFPHDDRPDRSWTSQAVDAVAGVLRGDYEVEEVYRGHRLVKTRVVDLRAAGGPRVLGGTGTLLGWLRRRAPERTRRRRVDFATSPPTWREDP